MLSFEVQRNYLAQFFDACWVLRAPLVTSLFAVHRAEPAAADARSLPCAGRRLPQPALAGGLRLRGAAGGERLHLALRAAGDAHRAPGQARGSEHRRRTVALDAAPACGTCPPRRRLRPLHHHQGGPHDGLAGEERGGQAELAGAQRRLPADRRVAGAPVDRDPHLHRACRHRAARHRLPHARQELEVHEPGPLADRPGDDGVLRRDGGRMRRPVLARAARRGAVDRCRRDLCAFSHRAGGRPEQPAPAGRPPRHPADLAAGRGGIHPQHEQLERQPQDRADAP